MEQEIMTEQRNISIHVPVLARVEGEGALDLQIKDGLIEDLKLTIFEPPRLFEKFLEQRETDQVIDMVARICGICPVAYQMTAVHAFERLFEVEVTPWIRNMRRVFYCGEWLQSHALHIHLLAAPDFLGFNSVIEMATKHAAEVRRGLRLQTLGNDLIALFGGRSVHPVGARTGGFYHAPDIDRVSAILTRLQDARLEATDLLRWTASLPLPDDHQDFISVCLHHDDEYAMNEGRIVSSDGLDIDPAEYSAHFREFQIAHSTALYALLHEQIYMVGPLARINLNHDHLPQELQALLDELNIHFPSDNMFHSIIARAAEIWLVIDEAIRLLENYAMPQQAAVAWKPKAGIAMAATEAPRGLLWHRYSLDEQGLVSDAQIVPPTSQNQGRIEEDIKQSLQAFGLDNDADALRLHAETVIRNYDPCISCATHFLRLNIQRD
jgi:coenzyme F420-reducing hydrogenase alpha subunit